MPEPASSDVDTTAVSPHAPASTTAAVEIRLLTRADAHWHLDGLCELLLDGVEHGASLGFLAPLSRLAAAREWEALQDALSDDNLLWVAFDGARVVGSVRLLLEPSAGGRHRATVDRLVVRSSHQRHGIATRLLVRAEEEAIAGGRTLLVIDVESGSDAERALARRGWASAGTVPAYAAAPDGTLHDGTRLFRRLDTMVTSQGRRPLNSRPGDGPVSRSGDRAGNAIQRFLSRSGSRW